jgi:hypothetical protein
MSEHAIGESPPQPAAPPPVPDPVARLGDELGQAMDRFAELADITLIAPPDDYLPGVPDAGRAAIVKNTGPLPGYPTTEVALAVYAATRELLAALIELARAAPSAPDFRLIAASRWAWSIVEGVFIRWRFRPEEVEVAPGVMVRRYDRPWEYGPAGFIPPGITRAEVLAIRSARTLLLSARTGGQPPPGFPSLILGGPHERPVVRGRVKDVLTRQRYDVVKVLYDASPHRLGTPQIKAALKHNGTPHGDVVNLIKAVHRIDRDWGGVIGLAGRGGAGKGYGILP